MTSRFLYNDNEPAHKTKTIIDYLTTTKLYLLKQPPCSLDLVLYDLIILYHVKM